MQDQGLGDHIKPEVFVVDGPLDNSIRWVSDPLADLIAKQTELANNFRLKMRPTPASKQVRTKEEIDHVRQSTLSSDNGSPEAV